MMNKKCFTILLITAIYCGFILLSSILTIGEQLNRLHSYVEISFYIFSGFLFWFLILKHILRVFLAKEEKVINYTNYKSPIREKIINQELERISKLDFFKNGLPKEEDCEKQLIKAYELLDKKSDEIITTRARTVFLTTAFSQNGKLDFFFVLSNQIKLIRELTDLNRNRPSIKELYKIYSNVFFNAIGADMISEADITSHVTQVMSGTVMTNIPYATATCSIIASSVLEGSANGFLTLRVGYLTTGLLSNKHDELGLRNNASLKATTKFSGLLVEVVKTITTYVTGALGSKIKNAGESVVENSMKAAETVVDTGKQTAESVYETGKKTAETVLETGKQAADSVGETITHTGGKIKDVTTEGLNYVSETADKGLNFAGETGESILKETVKGAEKVGEAGNYVYEQGKDIIENSPKILKGITSKFGSIFNSKENPKEKEKK